MFSVPKNYRKPRFLESLKAILTEEGLVSFECKVVGYPTPQLRWFKDGQELKPGDVYQLTGTNSLGMYLLLLHVTSKQQILQIFHNIVSFNLINNFNYFLSIVHAFLTIYKLFI